MCKVLALSALLASSNAKASTIVNAVVSTASAFSTADVLWCGSLALTPRVSPEVNTLISLSTIAIIRTVSVVSGSLAVSYCFWTLTY